MEMKIGVAGAGAVGSFFGGLLAANNNDVTFLARGDHYHTLKESGLTIIKGEEKIAVTGHFTIDILDLADSDIVLFCVKAIDTIEMANKLAAILNKEAKILTMQNGVDNEEYLIKIFGENRVLSAATYVQAAIDTPGTVRQSSSFYLMVGELAQSAKASCEMIVQLFSNASIDARHAENILETKWSKFLWNITFNPLTAITGAKVGEILDNQQLKKTAEEICKEAVMVANCKGIKVDIEKAMNKIFSRAEFARTHQTSMLQDRLKGKRMEVESMCGYLVKQANEMNLATPVVHTIYSILKFIDDNQEKKDELYANNL
ncbi:2-dehydropantoate 2-reductase [Cytobacillus horneckiae]|uniref:2-dehydropantoate 2-reductase n=2 Tax=Cytobacillus horneckiae TaxID=549687 RepID=A0A2N0Z9E2_9BACI|nr:2-dehydropantoate 2-reductase [Cytobacillus horneckiae]